MNRGHGEKLTRKQEQAIAALLECSTIEQAAAKIGAAYSTLKRWLREPAFDAEYRRARRELLDTAVGRIQAATGTAVDTLLAVAKDGEKDSDRVRAAVAILDHAARGIEVAASLKENHDHDLPASPIKETSDVIRVLAAQLERIAVTDMGEGERSRLTATLADAMLRAIAQGTLAARLEALANVLQSRKLENKT